jgi:hypothetical protein
MNKNMQHTFNSFTRISIWSSLLAYAGPQKNLKSVRIHSRMKLCKEKTLPTGKSIMNCFKRKLYKESRNSINFYINTLHKTSRPWCQSPLDKQNFFFKWLDIISQYFLQDSNTQMIYTWHINSRINIASICNGYFNMQGIIMNAMMWTWNSFQLPFKMLLHC